ncbi:MAG: hypothetical protein ACR2PA_26530 [Hyphomicrobiaceae bacterium]
MLRRHCDFSKDREKIIGSALGDFAGELKLINVIDFVAYIRTEKYGNIENLVNSAAELYFMPESLKFGHSGRVELDWDQCPVVVLDMEFNQPGVHVYFQLKLLNSHAEVEIDYIHFSKTASDPMANSVLLETAIGKARLM